MNTYRATITDEDKHFVSVGCGAINLLSAEAYFSATVPAGWSVLSIERIGR